MSLETGAGLAEWIAGGRDIADLVTAILAFNRAIRAGLEEPIDPAPPASNRIIPLSRPTSCSCAPHIHQSACAFSHAPKTRTTEGKLAAGSKVSLRAALSFPRLLLLLPDRIQPPRNNSAISL